MRGNRRLGAIALALGVVMGGLSAPAIHAEAASAPAEWAVRASAAAKASSTPVVQGRMLKAYRKAGGLKKWGRPTANQKCGLPERGCLQHFQKGTFYLQSNGRYWTTTSRGVRGEILIVTRSQVGTKQSTAGGYLHKTKYSRYTGQGPSRWCNHLHSWVGYASGNTKVIPRIAGWDKMKSYMAKNWKRQYKPVRGAYIVMNGSGPSTHMAMVWMVRPGNRVTIIEGNWGKRVNMRTIPVVKSMKFYNPYA